MYERQFDQDLRNLILEAVEEARTDQVMANSLSGGEWDESLDAIARVAMLPLFGDEASALDRLCDLWEDRVTSRALEHMLRPSNDNGLLWWIRDRLGINELNEKPFRISVVNVARQELSPEFRVLADLRNSLFNVYGWVSRTGDQYPVIRLFRDDAQAVLHYGYFAEKSEEEFAQYWSDNYDAISTIQHEYFHTQVELRLATPNRFGSVFDEAAASVLVGDTSYERSRAYLKGVSMITGFDILGALKNQVTVTESPISFFRDLRDAVGSTAFVLLMTADNGEYLSPLMPDVLSEAHSAADRLISSLIVRQIRAEGPRAFEARFREEARPYLDSESELLDPPTNISALEDHKAFFNLMVRAAEQIFLERQGRSTGCLSVTGPGIDTMAKIGASQRDDFNVSFGFSPDFT